MSDKIGNLYCFISLPFVDSSEDKSLVDYIYSTIKRIVENRGYALKGTDAAKTSGLYVYDQIQYTIKNSSFVIALLWNNQNIIYEIGISVGLGKDIIILSPSDLKIPLNLLGSQVFKFNRNNPQEIVTCPH